MTPATERILEPLLWGLAAIGLCLVLTVLALGFVWLAMDTDGTDAPDVRPPAVQPGPPIKAG
jgi:hypothetical protein